VKQVKVLIVDDDTRILATLASFLRESGFGIVTATSIEEARQVNNCNVDLVLLDLALPDGSGIELLQEIRVDFPGQTVVMISGQATLTDAVKAIKLGAADFLEKPVSPEKVELSIRNALKLSGLQRKHDQEQQGVLQTQALVGESDGIREVRSQIEAVSRTDSAVLLLGESGTGKEVAANLIHLKSSRNQQPFVAVNAAAIPRELIESELFGHEKGAFTGASRRRVGRFEQADGGTLFLDEIAEMPAQLQTKLLRVLEERRVRRVGGNEDIEIDFRLLSATNRDLRGEINRGNFRQDLFFRINVFAIELPPLRMIPGDIPAIARHHVRLLAMRMGRPVPQLPDELLAELAKYRFPGNVRELRNILEHLLILHRGERLPAAGLRKLLASGIRADNEYTVPLKDAVRRFELDYIRSAIDACGGNVSQAAANLGLDRSYLYRKIRQLELEDSDD
jgi:two-component system nitrogen regulation response regulator NtrX